MQYRCNGTICSSTDVVGYCGGNDSMIMIVVWLAILLRQGHWLGNTVILGSLVWRMDEQDHWLAILIHHDNWLAILLYQDYWLAMLLFQDIYLKRREKYGPLIDNTIMSGLFVGNTIMSGLLVGNRGGGLLASSIDTRTT